MPTGFFVPFVPAGGRAFASYSVSFPRRGLHRLPDLRLSTGFPFGFFERSAWYRKQSEVLVYPALGRLRREPLRLHFGREIYQGRARTARAAGDEFYGVRPYRPGDNPKRIHWKSSARLRRLAVKEMETERQTAVELVLDARLPRAEGGGLRWSRASTRRGPRPELWGARAAYGGGDGQEWLCHLFELAVSFTATCLVEYYQRDVAVRLRILAPESGRSQSPQTVRSAERGARPLAPLLRELALVEAVPEDELRSADVSAGTLAASFGLPGGWAQRLVVTVGRGELLAGVVGPRGGVVDVAGDSFQELFEPPPALLGGEVGLANMATSRNAGRGQ